MRDPRSLGASLGHPPHIGPIGRRTLGSPVLFAIIATGLAGGVYVGLGVVAGQALGLTPVVFLLAALFLGLALMTYAEGAALHPDRGGSTVFARYATNELVSFVAGWVVVLDYIILIALCAISAVHYAAAFWSPLDEGWLEVVLSLAVVAYVAQGSVRGWSKRRSQRLVALICVDLVIQVLVVIAGLIAFFSWDALTAPIDLGTSPSWGDVIFAVGIAGIVASGLESAASLSGEVLTSRRDLKRLVVSSTILVGTLYVAMAVVGLTALPVVDGRTALGGSGVKAPLLAITGAFEQAWLRDGLTYLVGAAAALTLVEVAASAMLGVARLAYSLSTNRQIPSRVGRLHPRYGTPVVVIVLVALLAGALVVPSDLDLLAGIYAFGALLGITIAHVSVVLLRARQPDAPRLFRVPLDVHVRGVALPLPSIIGAIGSGTIWITVVVLHDGARFVGMGWLLAGVVLYVAYRRQSGKPILKRVTVPEAALRRDRHADEDLGEFGSILVPLWGTPIDDDIIQTAGRLAADEHDDFDSEEGATIEALWVFEVPMALPIDGRLPDAQLQRARDALRRAKAVGEEYQGVEVATATVRARRRGEAIVDEARRRGVEAIVLAAEEPTRIRGGALLGGRAGANDTFLGPVARHVLAKAHCQVILTAPAQTEAAPAVAAGPGSAAPTK